MTRDQVVERVARMVGYARSLCDDVEFSPEDAARSCPEFLVRVLTAAIEAGATTLNIPDTVGYCLPEEYGQLIARLIHETPGAGRVVWSVHCHDDLGLATANTLAGIQGGARQAEVTINGLGERAGNAAPATLINCSTCWSSFLRLPIWMKPQGNRIRRLPSHRAWSRWFPTVRNR